MTECRGLAGVAGHSNKALMTYPSGCRLHLYVLSSDLSALAEAGTSKATLYKK